MSSETSHAGLLLLNRYQLDEPIGRGALCTIYRGQDTVLRRSVAVKAVAPELIECFRDTLAATAELTHPAAVATYDALEHEGWLFLVQEYVTARPLSAYLRDGVPSERAVDLAAQVARALAYAHAHGIAHGDLTPAAVLVDRRAIARVNNFASPPDAAYFERCRREWPVEEDRGEPLEQRDGPAGDVQAMGYLLWHLLAEPRQSGGLNGGGDMRRAFRSDVPERLRESVRRCVVASHAEPIQDAEALVAELEAISRELAGTRTQGIEQTPPALRVAREMIAREAAWSAEETLGGVRYWAEEHPSDSFSPTAPTDPIPWDAGAWHGPVPAAELTPRLRLPSRPVDDMVSSALSDFAGGSPVAAVPVVAGREQMGRPAPASAPTLDDQTAMEGGGHISFALIVVLGIALFLLFFIVGYFSSRLFGIG